MAPLRAEEINKKWNDEEEKQQYIPEDRLNVMAGRPRPVDQDNSGHIKAALDRLDNAIADINGVANQLAHNIDPITLPVPVAGLIKETDVSNEVTSEMEDFINRLTREADSIVKFLVDLNRAVRL